MTLLLNQQVEGIFALQVPHPLSHISMQVAARRESSFFFPSVLTVWLCNPRPEQQLLYCNNDKEKPSVGRRLSDLAVALPPV